MMINQSNNLFAPKFSLPTRDEQNNKTHANWALTAAMYIFSNYFTYRLGDILTAYLTNPNAGTEH